MDETKIGKYYKVKEVPSSRLLRGGILQVTKIADGAVSYRYLSVNGVVHPESENYYAQDFRHFIPYTVELTELEAALL